METVLNRSKRVYSVLCIFHQIIDKLLKNLKIKSEKLLNAKMCKREKWSRKGGATTLPNRKLATQTTTKLTRMALHPPVFCMRIDIEQVINE